MSAPASSSASTSPGNWQRCSAGGSVYDVVGRQSKNKFTSAPRDTRKRIKSERSLRCGAKRWLRDEKEEHASTQCRRVPPTSSLGDSLVQKQYLAFGSRRPEANHSFNTSRRRNAAHTMGVSPSFSCIGLVALLCDALRLLRSVFPAHQSEKALLAWPGQHPDLRHAVATASKKNTEPS